MVRDKSQTIAKHLKDRDVIRIAEARCGLDERIEYPLQIEGRPADDLQDIGGGRLLLQGFCQLAFALLLRLKQSAVLDRDDSLVGESLEQTDLLFSEWSHFGAADANGADRFTLLPLQWNSQRSSEAIPDRHRLAASKIRPGCS